MKLRAFSYRGQHTTTTRRPCTADPLSAALRQQKTTAQSEQAKYSRLHRGRTFGVWDQSVGVVRGAEKCRVESSSASVCCQTDGGISVELEGYHGGDFVCLS